MSFISKLMGMNTSESENIELLDASEFRKGIQNKEAQLVDVRTKREFQEGAIETARNIDFTRPQFFNSEIEKLDKSKPVYLYCRSGNRSHQAALKLEKMGFQEIYDLRGGIMSWNNS